MLKDTEIKKSMYKEFENSNNYISVKSSFFEIMKNLGQDDLINSPDFRLEDTMSAFVINHYKMDPHSHNEKIKIKNDKKELLKILDNFTFNDTLYTIFDLFKKEISLFYNIPIYQCYLTNILSFLSEEDLDLNNNLSDMNKINYNIVCCFVLSYKFVIYLLFHSLTNSSCLRDEDLPSFLYKNCKYLNKPKSLDYLLDIIKEIENNLEKYNQEKQLIEQILLIMKLQTGIINILKIFLNSENEKEKKEIKLTKDNYDKQINSILEEVDKIDISIYPKDIEECKNIHKKELHKLMPVIGTYKNIKIFEAEECLNKFKELLNDFREIRRIFNTTNLYHLYKLIHNINNKKEINSPSFIIRHIIDMNIDQKDNNLFGNKATKKIFKNLLNEYNINTKINENDENPESENEILTQLIELYQNILKYELKNRARKIREGKEIINNLVGFVIFIYKKEKEINENQQNKNIHQHKGHNNNQKDNTKSYIKNFVVFNLLKVMLSTIFNCFYIDFFKFHELDYIFWACHEISDQILKHLYLFAKLIDNNDILLENNIANSIKKKNFKDERKVIFDEIYIYNSYKNAFEGLKLLLYYIKYYNLIRIPKLDEKDIELRISNRFPFFQNSSVIINLSYDEFMSDYNKSLGLFENADFIDSAKELLQIAKKNLNELIKADTQLRDIFMNGNPELNELSKVIISNSLIFNKVKKFKEEKKENDFMKFNINVSKYNSKFPLLEIIS